MWTWSWIGTTTKCDARECVLGDIEKSRFSASEQTDQFSLYSQGPEVIKLFPCSTLSI